MPAAHPTLFPRPRELSLRGGFLLVPAQPHPTAEFLANLPTTIAAAQAALAAKSTDACRSEFTAQLGADSYTLAIHSEGILLRASDAAGLLYGAQTLRQIHAQNPDALPCLEILDGPDLSVRGFMLDVSRCKVPTQAELLDLIRALGQLRVNQLQLYVEHTFAFPGHEDAWRDASPLTPAEIRELDAACAALGIELVPNLNTFGHMERWLRHPRYRTLAECPQGWIHPLTGQFKEFPGTLKPDEASLAFVAELLDSYLPCFRSRQVNIGGDEPWELGQGFSQEAVATHGKHRVYLDHLRQLCALVTQRGHTPQFWGDILLEDLALAQDAPQDALPVVWGYDAGHPFATQCGRLQELGRAHLVAPGTSAWQSFTGRLDNALANQTEAVGNAFQHGARGVLVTTWGDNGTHQPWPTAWLPMAAGLAQAWSFTANQELDAFAACRILGGLAEADASAVAAALTHLGRLDNQIAKANRNKSLSWDFLTAAPAALAGFTAGVSPTELTRSLAYLEESASLVAAIQDSRVQAELSVGAELARAGLRRAAGQPLTTEASRELRERFERTWLARARRGGLAESVAGLGLA
jgi:hexosaminidase